MERMPGVDGEWIERHPGSYRVAPERVWLPFPWPRRLVNRFNRWRKLRAEAQVRRWMELLDTPHSSAVWPTPWGKVALFGGLATSACACIWGIVHLYTMRAANAEVVKTAWSYTAELREKTRFHNETWGVSEPGAFNVACDRRFHYMMPVSCGKNCTTLIPVFDDWCSYDYYAWPVVRAARTTGGTQRTYWPALSAAGVDQRLERSARYRVDFLVLERQASAEDQPDNDVVFRYRPTDVDSFRRFTKGAMWVVRVNNAGQVQPVREL